MEIDGLEIAAAVPSDDGSYTTTLTDPTTNTVVATITRASNGQVVSSQPPVVDTDTGFDWGNVLNQVTGFLDKVAAAAKQTSDQAQRISNATKGAEVGARAGYNAPLNLTPWLIAGGLVVGGLIVASAVRKR